MAESEGDPVLGPWSVSELVETARAEAGAGVDDGIPAIVRFKSNVAKLLRRRHAHLDSERDPAVPAVFLLQPTPPAFAGIGAISRKPMLDNGLTTVTGRIWFVAPPVASGKFVDFVADEDDELFRFVTDTLKLGATPAVVFDPRTGIPDVRFYKNGLVDPDAYEHVSLGGQDITLDQVFAAIERIYQQCLVTPEATTEANLLWHDRDRWRPASNAEAVVQYALKSGLVGAFPTCDVRHEQTMPEGRADLEIEERDPLDRSNVTRHALLEIKVLRSFWQPGGEVTPQYTRAWIESGVRQAAEYRDSKGSRASALCCFDMRKVDTGEACFEHVLELGNVLSVKLKRWFLYAKSEHLRKARNSCS